MVAIESSLTTGERKKLTQHEEVIERGLHSFVDVGNALLAIQRDKLYTDVDGTFEGYCKKRWNIGKSQAYRYIESAKVVTVLSPMGDVPPPANERQARVLAELPDEQTQANVWAKAVETAPKDKHGTPKVTAAHVKKVAAEVSPKPAKPEPVVVDVASKNMPLPDEGGFEPHEASKPLQKIDELLTRMMEQYSAAEKILGKNDAEVLALHAGLDAAYKALTKLRGRLRRAK